MSHELFGLDLVDYGLHQISAGYDNCYAERFSERFRGVPGHPFEHGWT
jgi:hypothetical protein